MDWVIDRPNVVTASPASETPLIKYRVLGSVLTDLQPLIFRKGQRCCFSISKRTV